MKGHPFSEDCIQIMKVPFAISWEEVCSSTKACSSTAFLNNSP